MMINYFVNRQRDELYLTTFFTAGFVCGYEKLRPWGAICVSPEPRANLISADIYKKATPEPENWLIIKKGYG
jgi:hypothetical protein